MQVICSSRIHSKKSNQLVILVSLVISICVGCTDNYSSGAVSAGANIDILKIFSQDSSGSFARVQHKKDFIFPKDHGPHLKYKYEWWYFSGNLHTDLGRRFGYQLTIFRVGLKNEFSLPNTFRASKKSKNVSRSKWRSNHIYMAHFAVTDIEGKRFYPFQKVSRDNFGLAGSQHDTNPDRRMSGSNLKLWVHNWSVESLSDSVFPLRLKASSGGVSIDLAITQSTPVVLNGSEGMSMKGSEAGNASYYYSIPRLDTRGEIEIEGFKHKVKGKSWFDREWFTSAFKNAITGWDWFAIQLEDDREIMLYYLRNQDNAKTKHSGGTIIERDGKYKRLDADDIIIIVKRYWQSPKTGISYPAGWKVAIPSHSIEMLVTPLVEDQELDFIPHYWEGAVRVSAVDQSENHRKSVTGLGYVELVGYKN